MDRRRINIVYPPNVGWLQYKLSDKEMDYVWRCVETGGVNWKSKLAGNIHSSYRIKDRSDWFFNNTVSPLCDRYAKTFGNLGDGVGTTLKHPYQLTQWWVNYQKQGEFNPLHNHSGIYSFVIWLKIPTHWKEQQKLPIANGTNSNAISNFSINFTDILGGSAEYVYRMCPELEGTMLFFPANLDHMVYPFYNCNEDRVSVSGNIEINTAKRM